MDWFIWKDDSGRPAPCFGDWRRPEADFDLKAIKALPQWVWIRVTAHELTEEVDEYDVAEEVFEDVPLGDETTPLETEGAVSQADQVRSWNSEAAS